MATRKADNPEDPKSGAPAEGQGGQVGDLLSGIMQNQMTLAEEMARMKAVLAELAATAQPAKPDRNRGPVYAWKKDLPDEIMEKHRDGFITIEIAQTRDPTGDEPYLAGAPDRLLRIHRNHPTTVPIRFALRVWNAKVLGTKLVTRPEFAPEQKAKYKTIEDVPTMMTETVPVQTKTWKMRGSVKFTRPTDDQLAWARKVFPGDARAADEYNARLKAQGEVSGQ